MVQQRFARAAAAAKMKAIFTRTTEAEKRGRFHVLPSEIDRIFAPQPRRVTSPELKLCEVEYVLVNPESIYGS